MCVGVYGEEITTYVIVAFIARATPDLSASRLTLSLFKAKMLQTPKSTHRIGQAANPTFTSEILLRLGLWRSALTVAVVR